MSLQDDVSFSQPTNPNTGPFGLGYFLPPRFSGPLGRAASKLGWPLFNQAVVSGGNFLTLVIVARALPEKSDYGIFGLVLELMFYLNTIPAALVTYPLTIKGATAADEDVRRMTSASLWLTFAMAIPVILGGLGVATISHRATLGFAAAFALVAWQLQEVTRRALMARFRYATSTWGDGVRYIAPAIALWVVWKYGSPSLAAVFTVIGACALAGLLIQTIQLRPAAVTWRDVVSLPRDSWRTARWVLLTSVMALLTSLLTVWTLTARFGTETVGDFYAIANFTKPINPLITTFAGLVMQYAAKHFADGGIVRARKTAIRLSSLALASTLPLLVALMIFPGMALRLFYGKHSHFGGGESELVLRIFAASFIVFVLTSMTGAFLNGVHRTRANFMSQIAASVAVLVLAFPLTIKFGLLGMLIGGTVAAIIQLGVMMWFAIRTK